MNWKNTVLLWSGVIIGALLGFWVMNFAYGTKPNYKGKECIIMGQEKGKIVKAFNRGDYLVMYKDKDGVFQQEFFEAEFIEIIE